MGVEVLPPIVAQLQSEHPSLKIELMLTNRVQDLLRRDADIAVRMTLPKQDRLIARRVGMVERSFHAHQTYLRTHGTPLSLEDLAQHVLIGFDEETPFLRAARKALPLWQRDAFTLRTDSGLAQLALIRSGAGIGICQVALARRDAQLVRVLPDHFAFNLETWLTMHEDLRHSPRCKVSFDALLAGLQRQVNLGALLTPRSSIRTACLNFSQATDARTVTKLSDEHPSISTECHLPTTDSQ